MDKKYSFPNEEIARLFINTIGLNSFPFNQYVKGLVEWGFEHKWSIPITEGEVSVIIKQGTTYNVDIAWKVEPFISFQDYEIHPITPSHEFL